jgi:hypothetical protein
MEAEDTDEFVRLAGALSKLGRGLRQSLALHARFEKERRDAAAEAADGPAPAAPTSPGRTPSSTPTSTRSSRSSAGRSASIPRNPLRGRTFRPLRLAAQSRRPRPRGRTATSCHPPILPRPLIPAKAGTQAEVGRGQATAWKAVGLDVR